MSERAQRRQPENIGELRDDPVTGQDVRDLNSRLTDLHGDVQFIRGRLEGVDFNRLHERMGDLSGQVRSINTTYRIVGLAVVIMAGLPAIIAAVTAALNSGGGGA